MTRVAAIDCGTNSLRLLIADSAADGLAEISKRMEIVRLGEGVDRTGELTQPALVRAAAVLNAFASELTTLGVTRVRMIATSALRDARNAEVFVALVRSRLGIAPEIIDGRSEAALAFRGATYDLATGRRYRFPHLVLDIGGGSTELVCGQLGGENDPWISSMDIGAVRLTERHFRHDPPTADEVTAARADIAVALESVGARPRGIGTVIGVAGSVTTVAAVVLGLTSYQPAQLHHAVIDAATVSRVVEGLLTASPSERSSIPAIHPGRVDVIGAGGLILDEVLRWIGLPDLLISEHDMLHGIALGMLDVG